MAQLENTSRDIPKEQKENFPYLVHEILDNFDDFQVGERQTHGQNDSHLPVTYKGERCIIQTCEVRVMFGINDYLIPGNTEKQYSLHISLKETSKDVEELAQFLNNMDKIAQEYQINSNHTYVSCIRPYNKDPTQKSPVLRFKVNRKNQKFIVDIIDIDGKMYSLPTLEQFRKLVPHESKVKVLFEVNPIWYANKKYGISYRLLQILVISRPKKSVSFRDH